MGIKPKIIAGVISFLFPFYVFCLWIFVFNKYPNLQERNTQFLNLITFFDSPGGISILSIILCLASIFLLGRINPKTTILRIVIYSIIAINVFLLIFNVWGLL